MQRPFPLIPTVDVAGAREGDETMKLDDPILKLISVGASVAANCQPCLEACVARARESGADEEEIGEAIEVAKRVRPGAASKMDQFATRLCSGQGVSVAPGERCGCGPVRTPAKGGGGGSGRACPSIGRRLGRR